MAWKITLPIDQSKGELQFKSIPFEEEFDKVDWIERWGVKDGNAFVSKIFEGIFHFKFIDLKLGFELNYSFVDFKY